MFARLLTILLLTAIPCAAQTIIAPRSIVAGDPVPVRVTGLKAGAEVEIGIERAGASPLRSTARFRADQVGSIDLARDVALSGDYVGRDPAGLFWSMHRAGGGIADLPPDTLRVTVSQGERKLTKGEVTVLGAEPGLVVGSVPGFPGATLHRRPGTEQLPVVVLLGGSEGGDGFGRGMVPFIVRQGWAALVFPYHAPPWIADSTMKGLSVDFADIPVDRLGALRDWIAAQPGLNPSRIAVIGASKGAEFAMIAAQHYPWLRAVVGIVPSDVVWEGWGAGVQVEGTRSSFSWDGRPLPFVPYTGMGAAIAALGRGEPAALAPVHVAGRRDHPNTVAGATIGVERYRGPMMVVGGGRDAVWPSSEMAQNIAARRQAAGLSTELLIFPEAGHNLSGSGWSPLLAWGPDSTAVATARAQAAVRPRLTRFLRSALR